MLLYAVAIVAFHDLAALEAAASAVAGAPVSIDRRLRLAQCAAPPGFTQTGLGLSVECASPPWRIFVASQRLEPIIHRGDAVSVGARGPGFDVSIDGTAEADAAPGARLRVRDRSGGHLTALVRPDGSLTAPGYNLP
jgi:hypothetical protein